MINKQRDLLEKQSEALTREKQQVESMQSEPDNMKVLRLFKSVSERAVREATSEILLGEPCVLPCVLFSPVSADKAADACSSFGSVTDGILYLFCFLFFCLNFNMTIHKHTQN